MRRVKLDRIDRRILSDLQANGRITNVELSRRAGDFDEARRRISNASHLNSTKIKWLPGALAHQKRLLAAKDSSPHEMDKTESESR